MDVLDHLEGNDTGQRPLANFENFDDTPSPTQPLLASADYGSGKANANFDQIRNDHKDDESNVPEHSDVTETPARAAGGVVDSGRQKRRSKKKRRNPKMLLVDFRDPNDTIECFDRIRTILGEVTPDGSYESHDLPRGGLQLTFRRVRHRKAAQKAITSDEFLCGKMRQGYLRQKKSWQVKIDHATDAIRTDMECMDGVLVTHMTPRRRLIISVNTREQAEQMCQDGYRKDLTIRPIDVWVRPPTLGCRTCGDLTHRRCQQVRCFKCGGTEHTSSDCQEDMKCLYCSSAHDSRRCPRYRKERSEAYSRKQKSYREVVLGLREPTPVVEDDENEFEDEVADVVETHPMTFMNPMNHLNTPEAILEVFMKLLRMVIPVLLTNVNPELFDRAEQLVAQTLRMNEFY